jgi:hypothetical protein
MVQGELGGVPARIWAENLQAGFIPCLHNTVEEVRVLLYRSEERTLQRSGIDFESLRYQSPALARLRSTLVPSVRVHIKYDPADLSALYVFDPSGSGAWLPGNCQTTYSGDRGPRIYPNAQEPRAENSGAFPGD